jgi:hypothetical protein
MALLCQRSTPPPPGSGRKFRPSRLDRRSRCRVRLADYHADAHRHYSVAHAEALSGVSVGSRVFFTYACDSIGCHQHNPSLQGMNTRGSFPSGTAFPFAMHKTRCQHHNRRVANNFAPKLQLFHINSAEHTGTPMTWNQTSELKLAWLCEVPDNLVRFLRR